MNKENPGVTGRANSPLVSVAFALLLTAIATEPAFAQDMKTVSSSLASRITASGRKTVAVIDFTDLQGNVTELGRFLAEELSVDLVGDAKGFEVIERTQLKVILQEHKLATTGLVDPQTARKLGQIAGVDALVTGTITPFGDTVRVSTKVLDTTTARMIGAYTGDVPKTRAIEELLAKGIASPQPTSGPESPKPTGTGASRDASVVSVEENDLLFVLRVCRRSGSVLSCSGSITNKGGTRRTVTLVPDKTQLIDDLGNFCKVRDLAFGSAVTPEKRGDGAAVGAVVGAISGGGKGAAIGAAGQRPQSGLEQQELEPELPVNFSLSVDGVNRSASRVSIILSYEVGGIIAKVALRNAPIQQK